MLTGPSLTSSNVRVGTCLSSSSIPKRQAAKDKYIIYHTALAACTIVMVNYTKVGSPVNLTPNGVICLMHL